MRSSGRLQLSPHLPKRLQFSPPSTTSVYLPTTVVPPLVPLTMNQRETKLSSSLKAYTPYILVIPSSVHAPTPLYFVSVMETCTMVTFSSIQPLVKSLGSLIGNVLVSVLGG